MFAAIHTGITVCGSNKLASNHPITACIDFCARHRGGWIEGSGACKWKRGNGRGGMVGDLSSAISPFSLVWTGGSASVYNEINIGTCYFRLYLSEESFVTIFTKQIFTENQQLQIYFPT